MKLTLRKIGSEDELLPLVIERRSGGYVAVWSILEDPSVLRLIRIGRWVAMKHTVFWKI